MVVVSAVLLFTTVLAALWAVALLMLVRQLREELHWLLLAKEAVQATLWEQAQRGRPR